MIECISKRGEKMVFNAPDDPTNLVAMRLNRCSEVECGPTGFFLSYPLGEEVQVKADVDTLTYFIGRDVLIVLTLEEFDGELWLVVGTSDDATLLDIKRKRHERIVHHLAEKLMGIYQKF